MVEEVEVFLLALVFITMMLKGLRKEQEKTTAKNNQGQTTLERVRAQKYQKITIYMMHVMNAHMMHALRH